MKKRILAGALACAMAFSLSTVALAADIETVDDETGTYTSGEITGTSSVTELVVKVTVPTDGFDVVVNPYQLEAKIGDDESTASRKQIIAKSMELVSASNVDLAVGIKIGAEPSTDSGAVVSTTPVTATTKTKSVFTYLEVTGGKEGFEAKDSYNATTNKAQQFAFPAIKRGGTAEKPTVSGYLEKAGVVTLANSSADEAKKKATFTINGGAATNPTEVWTAEDTLSYSITYNFVPVVTAPEPTPTPEPAP